MQRYFLRNDQITNGKVTIDGDDAHHISKVMRMETGSSIICCNESGQCARCEITGFHDQTVSAEVKEWIGENPELPVFVTIAQGLPKGEKLELIVQKGTELGAASFLPFAASRSVVKWDDKKGTKKVLRLQKIAKEAAEQSHRSVIPKVESVISFQQLIDRSARYNIKLVAFEEEAKAGEIYHLAQALQTVQEGQSILAVVGPEGGLSDEEASLLKQAGFILCGLGPRILRTETAPLYLLSAVSYHLELLR